MKVIRVDNVNQALRAAVGAMREKPGLLHDQSQWIETSPRGMATREWYEPVTTVYHRPWRRVLFSALRDANPFFHLFESLWMLAGRRDAAFLDQFTANFSRYAEDDGNLHGAYGFRWRHHFGGSYEDVLEMDQLAAVERMLREDPNSRRVVLGMWDPTTDLAADKRDIPCNTHVYLKVRDNRLNMTVCCRSNDIVLGCYGANAVHFSVLQEYLAIRLGVMVGKYTHISDSWHYYLDNPFVKLVHDGVSVDHYDYYTTGDGKHHVRSLSLVNGPTERWDEELRVFMSDEWHAVELYQDIFFRDVAWTMRMAHEAYKAGNIDDALHQSGMIVAPDWRLACVEWLQRRKERRAA